jgi:hypothetical protein
MPEFIPTLVAGIVLLAIMFAAVSLPQLHLGPGGAFTAKPNDNRQHVMLAENAWVSESTFKLAAGNPTIDKQAGWLLPFAARPNEWEGGLLEFTVVKHEGGELVMKLNGHELYRGQPDAGTQQVEFPISYFGTNNVLEANVDEWVPLANPSYSFNATVYGTVTSSINQSFVGPISWKRAQLLVAFKSDQGDLIIRQDGKEIYRGKPDGFLNLELDLGKKRAHTIEFIAPPRAKHLIDFAEVEFER